MARRRHRFLPPGQRARERAVPFTGTLFRVILENAAPDSGDLVASVKETRRAVITGPVSARLVPRPRSSRTLILLAARLAASLSSRAFRVILGAAARRRRSSAEPRPGRARAR